SFDIGSTLSDVSGGGNNGRTMKPEQARECCEAAKRPGSFRLPGLGREGRRESAFECTAGTSWQGLATEWRQRFPSASEGQVGAERRPEIGSRGCASFLAHRRRWNHRAGPVVADRP